MLASTEHGQRLLTLFSRLRCYKVIRWASSSSFSDPGDSELALMNEADVVSSRSQGLTGRHVVALDIDHPAWLVKSSTEGHYHLYIDVPGGIEHDKYMLLLTCLADCGVIEEGYAKASVIRGRSDLRLPWIKKVQP
jgi:hypothetical protein